MLDDNKTKVCESGGIEITLKAINSHMNNINVCYYGCGVIWNIIPISRNMPSHSC